MKIKSARAVAGLFMLMLFFPIFSACTDTATGGTVPLRHRSSEQVESMNPDELAEYISQVDGETAAQQTARSVSVYEILKLAALLDPGGFTYTENISITSGDGVTLSANVFSPKGQGAGPFPAVVFINSWGMDEYEYQIPAATLAKKGYVALSYSARGCGKSGGATNFGGPRDMADMAAILDYLESHFPVDRANIAAAGISYGAMCALLALPQHSRIKTVACMSGPADFGRGLFNQDATNAYAIGSILRDASSQTVDPGFITMLDDLKDYRNIPSFRAWAATISAASFIDRINSSGKPIYMSHNFSDEMFVVNANMDFYARLTVPGKLDLNQGVHASAETGGVLGAENYVWHNVYRWLDYHLRGINNGIMGEAPVTMERKFDSGRDCFEAWPPARVKEKIFYLHPRKSVSDYSGEIAAGAYNGYSLLNPGGTTYNAISHLSMLADTIATTGIPEVSQLLEYYVDLPVKVLVDYICTGKGIVFKSGTLDSGMKIRGIIKLHMNASFSGGRGLLVAYLYDVNDYGIGKLLTHGARGFYDTTAGQTVPVDMELSALAYDLPAGHRLSVVIDTVDPLCDGPVGGYYEVRFRFAHAMQSSIEIPEMD